MAFIMKKNGDKKSVKSKKNISADITKRKKAERDITQLEKYKRELDFQATLLNSIQQAVIVVNEQGDITYWNDYATKLYGWQRDEAVGRPILNVTVPEFLRSKAMDIMKKLSNGEPWEGEFMVRRKTGENFIAHVSNSPIIDDHGNFKGVIGVSDDVTNEVESQQYIKFQDQLLDSVEEAVIATNLNHKIIYWNKHAEKLYGWTKEEIFGKSSAILIPNNPQGVEESIKIFLALKERKSISGEFTAINKKGEVISLYSLISHIIDLDSSPIGIISVSYDITERKKEELLREIEKLDKEALINTTKDFIWSIDKDLKLLAANHSMIETIQSQTGKEFKRGEVFSLHGLYPERYAQLFTDAHQRGLTGESFEMEFHSPISNQWYELTVRAIKQDEEIIGVACYNKNITQRKIDEGQKEMERLDKETLINTTQDFMWSVDKNLKLIAANQSLLDTLLKQTGKLFKRGDALSFHGLYPDEYAQFFEDSHKRGLGGETFHAEFQSPVSHNWLETTVKPIIKNNEVMGVACYTKNITERKLTEEAIRKSNERYDYVTRATNDYIYEIEKGTGKSMWVNNGMELLLGYPVNDETTSLDFWINKTHPLDRPRFIKELSEVLDDPTKNTWQLEYRILSAGNKYLFITDKAYIVRDESGKPTRIIGALQDITQKKETELLLKELAKKLEIRAHQLEESNGELERFAYVASHDLQEPLRMVSSFLQLLQSRYHDKLDETAQKYIHFAVDGSRRMKNLILDLLEYSRVGTVAAELTDNNMNEVVQEVLTVLSVTIKESDANIIVQPLPVLKNTRRTLMIQLMQNLIGNALKYRSQEKPEVVIDAKEDADNWTLSVKDNGIGFEASEAEKIFNVFQRLHTNNEYAGTGIGLSICKKIVERHGGKIWAESAQGKGSTFYFSLPKFMSEKL